MVGSGQFQQNWPGLAHVSLSNQEAYVSQQACKACTPVRRACRLCTPSRQACRLCTPVWQGCTPYARLLKACKWRAACGEGRAASARLSEAACSGCTPFFLGVRIGVRTPFGCATIKPHVDKIRIVGSLILEINTLTFYSNGVEGFVQGSWAEFKNYLFGFALPPLWRTKLRNRIQHLEMKDSEAFLTYSTRVHTLQSMVNFNNPTFSDFSLAEFVVLGLPLELKALVNNFQIMLTVPFLYSDFEGRVKTFYKGLPCRVSTRAARPTKTQSHPSNSTKRRPSQEETIWCIHAFLNSQGCCHFCKKTCGSSPGNCSGPIDQTFINIPSTFVAPPKPADYKPPKAATQAPAGRPPTCAATVAGVADGNLSPDLDAALVAAFAEINEELRLAKEEEYVSSPSKNRIVITLVCGDKHLRGLVDTGSELNLISEQAVQKLELSPRSLVKPTTIQLAMDNVDSGLLCYHILLSCG
ncbi:hypothetical protein PCASD_01194 [Puccinia coronata f. sp. avenae]|uniref:Uncharacterized protein n=1 Tax=Puccinia coronata f. sp. avenae TaxID=200324 RepID=A0A2N5VLJ2_9BASI|nr:hypothetical protein PCASD_01194 [Puccinia coronata f. sp. avenae]